METVVFYVFAALALTGALLVISFKNPVSSALSLVLTLFSTAVLFVLLLAHFIAVIQILEGVGTTLFTDYLLPFELTSVLILVAIIGVVAIAQKRAN